MAGIVIDKARWYEDGDGFWAAFRTQDRRAAVSLVSSIDKPHDLDVKAHRKKRSLDANAYLWVLLDALSVKLSTKDAPLSKVDIYRRLIPDVGGVSETVCVPTDGVDKLRQIWEHNGTGWVTDTQPSKIEGCTVVILYYGSSTYDTAQMSRLIDLVIAECKEQGIETMTPAELARLEGYGG
jgi:hypothetical protein